MRKVKRWKVLLCVAALFIMINAVQFPNSYANESELPKEEETEVDPGEDSEEPQQPVIERYELQIPKEDGEHGYYVTKPEIHILHVSEYGITKYQLYHEKELVIEGELAEKGKECIWKQEQFEEGNYCLKVWMEDLDGNELEEMLLEKEWKIDTLAPEISLSLPHGFDAWYQQEARLTIRSSDGGSNVKQVVCTSGGQKLGEFQDAQGSVMVNFPSTGGKGTEVEVCVWDYAGNCTTKTVRIYIDGAAPQVTMEGAENYMITSKPVQMSFAATDDNLLKNVQAKIVWETTGGTQKKRKVRTWNLTGERAQAEERLEKDGLYEITVKAEDMSGYQTEKKMQVILDQKNPVIWHVDELEQQYLKEFQWQYEPEETVRDFTTYTYEIRLDGNLYALGRTIEKEGAHTLEIQATDAANNTARAKAQFVIDHTKPQIIFQDVEEGETYEKQKTVKITLKDTGDKIKKITINGKEQNLSNRKMIYEYTMDEPQDYRMIVQAIDRAGNEAEESIFFTLEQEKTMLEKIAEPVKKVLFGEAEVKEMQGIKSDTKSGEGKFPIWVLSLLFILPVSWIVIRKMCETKTNLE